MNSSHTKSFLLHPVFCMYFVDLLSLVLSKKVTDMSLLNKLVIAGYSSLFGSIGTLLTFLSLFNYCIGLM